MSGLRVVVRTPHGVVVDEACRGARVPTASGQVGLRPRGEPMLLVVEPGLVVLQREGGNAPRFAATAGGLLEADRTGCTLHTPFAIAGDGEAEVLDALARAVATPDGELAARRRLGELEKRILREVRPAETLGRARSRHA